MCFFGILILIWTVLCVSGIRTYIGIKNPKEITGKDSPVLQEGNVVCLKYEYVFDESLNAGSAFGRNHNYELLKLRNKEEFLFCVIMGEDSSFWEGKPYYRMYHEIKEVESKDNYLFMGKVCKTKKQMKESLKYNAMISAEGIYKQPNTLTNTNYDYYIQYIEPEKEFDRMMGRVTFLGLLIVSGFLILKNKSQAENIEAVCENDE